MWQEQSVICVNMLFILFRRVVGKFSVLVCTSEPIAFGAVIAAAEFGSPNQL